MLSHLYEFDASGLVVVSSSSLDKSLGLEVLLMPYWLWAMTRHREWIFGLALEAGCVKRSGSTLHHSRLNIAKSTLSDDPQANCPSTLLVIIALYPSTPLAGSHNVTFLNKVKSHGEVRLLIFSY